MDNDVGIAHLRVELIPSLSACLLASSIFVGRTRADLQLEDSKVGQQVVLSVLDLLLQIVLHPRQVGRVVPVYSRRQLGFPSILSDFLI